ncbi:MAG TPA: PQQ-binding-like beta-propeller repeat protein [Conexibacter sp.]|nr:PQQ-binding-like beta-propeller repeat protein [Conexibacter sp.]
MGARSRRVAACRACLLAAAAIAALAGCGDSTGSKTGDSARPHASGPEWSAPNADLANTRRIASSIDARNVAGLRVAWTVPLRATYAATPIVSDGVVYTADLMSNVYAISLDNGRLLWRRDIDLPDTGPNGVNVAGRRVFGVTPGAAFALDAATGRELWNTQLVYRPGELIVMTPGYNAGIVYVSTVPTAGGNIATLWALDARTGHRLWRWEEVPPGLWGQPSVNGGGGLWHPPAFDERGALYVGVANPVPWPGTPEQPWGRSRPGPNRWNNSIVKLDAHTGRFLWGRQALAHDLYDWDLECPIVLANVGGRRVALASGKLGIVFAYDADSGALLWRRSVGIHNGHDDDAVRAMHGDYSNIGYGRRIYPGDWGGVETQMASDGTTVYVPVNNLYAIYHEQTLPEQQDPLAGTGEVVALDIATGRVRWDRRLPHGVYGGASVTNDLVFTTTYEGTVWALDRRTGAPVWHGPLPAGSIAPVAISGDTLLTAGAIALERRQRTEIVAYRLAGSDGSS